MNYKLLFIIALVQKFWGFFALEYFVYDSDIREPWVICAKDINLNVYMLLKYIKGEGMLVMYWFLGVG